MCFSAPVSFITGGVLTGLGIASHKRSRKKQWLLASVPLIFGLQQIIEGVQWLVPHPSTASLWLGYAFLVFAFLLWPIYAPATVLAMESNKPRKNALRCLLVIGVLIASYLTFVMIQSPLSVEIFDHHIAYNIEVPLFQVAIILYALVVSGAAMLSTDRHFRWLGILIVLSAAAAWLFFSVAFTSVWCFFAAVLSTCIYLHFIFHKPSV